MQHNTFTGSKTGCESDMDLAMNDAERVICTITSGLINYMINVIHQWTKTRTINSITAGNTQHQHLQAVHWRRQQQLAQTAPVSDTNINRLKALTAMRTIIEISLKASEHIQNNCNSVST
ncbi:hypothetical protein GPALN_014242 [Globodera pallida]|nr:hypothetical protein GPALN_014242 [Globodera pallida]